MDMRFHWVRDRTMQNFFSQLLHVHTHDFPKYIPETQQLGL